jgi:hypothetical protein
MVGINCKEGIGHGALGKSQESIVNSPQSKIILPCPPCPPHPPHPPDHKSASLQREV